MEEESRQASTAGIDVSDAAEAVALTLLALFYEIGLEGNRCYRALTETCAFVEVGATRA